MSLNIKELTSEVNKRGSVARVVVVDTLGSAPREAGANMLVWHNGQSGTIGGGALEYSAADDARKRLGSGSTSPHLQRMPLGPSLGQCCGGSVTLLTEIFNRETVPKILQDKQTVSLRAITKNGDDGSAALKVLNRNSSSIAVKEGWIAEKLSSPSRVVWIYGAGHVGRAIVNALLPLPQFAIVWLDTSHDRFPDNPPENDVDILVANDLAKASTHAPDHGEHLIFTYSHSMDLDICHQVLSKEFRLAGLIGSSTKWARFRKRLIEFGHSPEQVDRIICPIGSIHLGKHPQAIAIGVVSQLLAS